jgi:DNA repair exonuclease SbcCD ATPase subunit
MNNLALRMDRDDALFNGPSNDLRLPRIDDSSWSPVLAQVIAERDELKVQLENVRDLSDRLIDVGEAQQQRIEALETELRAKDSMIQALESENAELIKHVSSRENRISALESFLSMIAEADRHE